MQKSIAKLTVFKRILLGSCIGLFAMCNPGSTVGLIPTSLFFQEFQNKSYHLSPNGNFVSYLRKKENVSNIFIINTLNRKVIQITNFKIGGVKAYFWGNNSTIFYTVYSNLVQKLCYARADGSINKSVIVAKKIDFIENKLWDNKFLLLSIQKGNSGLNAYSMNIRTWKSKLISLNPGNVIKWKSDNNGKIRLAVASDGLNETILARDTERDTFKILVNSNFINTTTPIKFTDSNHSFYALSNLGTDKTTLVTINCASGIVSGVIKHTADVVDVNFKNNMPTQLEVEIAKKEILFFNTHWEAVYNKLSAILKTKYLKLLESDESGKVFLLKRYSDVQEDAYYKYDTMTESLVSLSENSTIPAAKLCRMKPVWFTARDGTTIGGYLTLPKGGNKHNSPCVILAHATPNGRDVWGYVPEVQFLASRGYAVFQINYRGSCGFGKNFKVAGFKNLGRVVQNDITDGAKWLRDKKLVNPKKIAIYGRGFGGFCALNAAFNHPDIFICAASYSGINNLFTYLKDYSIYGKPYQQLLNKTIGNPFKDAAYLREVSPIFNVNKIKIPIYVVQGAKDKLVSVNETNQFVKEIRKKNVEVKYLLIDTEGHDFVDNKNIIELNNQLDIFLKRNLN